MGRAQPSLQLLKPQDLKSKEDWLAVIAELEARSKRVKDVTDWDFVKQAEFIHDPSRLKAAQCTRRAGKSYGIGIYLINACLKFPGTTNIYTALTADSAKAIMYKDVLKVINREYNLGARFKEKPLQVVFPNESVISLVGMDQSDDECRKVLGQKFKLAVVDEAGSFRRDLRMLVYEMLKPGMMDMDGTICMISTTTDFASGLYYDVVEGIEPGWSVHKWSTADNPYMAEKFAAELEEIKQRNPRYMDTPAFKRMYLNQWAVDTDKLCYKFNSQRNLIPALPPADYTYVLGVDLGYNDDSAFTVVAFDPKKDRKLYVVESYSKPEMLISDVVERINYYVKTYGIERIVVDNAAKQAVKSMEERFTIPLTPAEKHGKAEFIEIMNSEFIQGNILLVEPTTQELATEYGQLIWDDKAHKRLEHPACDNHKADATLYAWRYAYHYLFQDIVKVTKTTEDKLEEWVQRQEELLYEQEQREKDAYAELERAYS